MERKYVCKCGNTITGDWPVGSALCVCGGIMKPLKANKAPVAEVPCSDQARKPCPFCGDTPIEYWGINKPWGRKTKCNNRNCPIDDIAMTPDQWDRRAL